jgi:mono/diheme cytochrome c family protein
MIGSRTNCAAALAPVSVRRFAALFASSLVMMAACDDSGADDARVTAILALSGDTARGEGLYAVECAGCHRADGRGSAGGGRGEDLTAWVGRNDGGDLIEAIIEGDSGMPAFGAFLDDQAIADIAAYVAATFGR